MAFTIAFDVPESENPSFPRRTYTASTSTLTTSLSEAQKFVDEETAEIFLSSPSVPESLRQWGVVVEVGSEAT